MLKFVSNSCRIVWVNSDTLLPFRIHVQQFTSLSYRRWTPIQQISVSSNWDLTCNQSFALRHYIGNKCSIKTNTINKKSKMNNSKEPYKYHATVGGEYQM